MVSGVMSAAILGIVYLEAAREEEGKRLFLLQRAGTNTSELSEILRRELFLLQEKSTLDSKRTNTGSLSDNEIISLLKIEIDLRVIKSEVSANRREFAGIRRDFSRSLGLLIPQKLLGSPNYSV